METLMWLQKTGQWFYSSHMSPHSVPLLVNLPTLFISQIESLNGLVTSCSESCVVVGDLMLSTGALHPIKHVHVTICNTFAKQLQTN